MKSARVMITDACRQSVAVLLLGVTVLLPTLTFGGLSGDAVIDTTLGTAYKIRAGGKAAGINRGTNRVKCNTPTAPSIEQQCPNDATYTPAAATGGYQAWGVGVKQMFGEGEPDVDCGAIPFIGWYDGSITITFVVICYIVPTTTPMGTWGNSIARLKWGASTAGTSQYGPHPTSVMAFHENTLDECHPFEAPNFAEAWCLDNTDSSYVDDNGYEAKILVSDSACQAIERSGNATDISNNCFYYHAYTQLSDLPAAYRDTTLGDAGAVLTLGFGSANGAAIDRGHTYTVKQFFKSAAQPIMLNTPAIHVGSITTELLSGAACIVGGFANNMCYYSVDMASVGGSGTEKFEQIP